jgi:hypothetical protein
MSSRKTFGTISGLLIISYIYAHPRRIAFGGSPSNQFSCQNDQSVYSVAKENEFSDMGRQNWGDCLRYKCEPSPCTSNQSVACCLDIMYFMLEDITRLLHERDFIYFATYGTLLGVVRESSPVPNELSADIDIALLDEHHRLLTSNDTRGILARFAFWRHGYTLFPDGTQLTRACINENYKRLKLKKIENSSINGTVDGRLDPNFYKYTDLYALSNWTSNYSIYYSTDQYVFKQDDIFPIRASIVGVHGNKKKIEVNVPAKSESILARLYGDWKKVIRTEHGCYEDSEEKCLRHWSMQKDEG